VRISAFSESFERERAVNNIRTKTGYFLGFLAFDVRSSMTELVKFECQSSPEYLSSPSIDINSASTVM